MTGGFRTERELQVFDLGRPGRDPLVTLKLGKTRRSSDGQKGLVSALAFSQHKQLIGVGTYSPGSIYLYDSRAQSTPVSQIIVSGTCVVGHGKSHSRKRKHYCHHGGEGGCGSSDGDGAAGNFFASAKVKWFQSRARRGVTQLEFSEEGASSYMYSLSRRSDAVIQWDLRKLSQRQPSSRRPPGIASFETTNDTNQRLEFALHKDHLFVGGQDNCVRVYDCGNPNEAGAVAMLNNNDYFDDSVNGLSVTSFAGKTIMASATGSRHFSTQSDYDDDDDQGGQSSSLPAPSGVVSIHELPNFLGSSDDGSMNGEK